MSFCRKWFAGDIKECRRLHEKHLKLMKTMFCEVNPIPVKEMMNQMGMGVGGYRLPLCEISEKGREIVRRALEGRREI